MLFCFAFLSTNMLLRYLPTWPSVWQSCVECVNEGMGVHASPKLQSPLAWAEMLNSSGYAWAGRNEQLISYTSHHLETSPAAPPSRGLHLANCTQGQAHVFVENLTLYALRSHQLKMDGAKELINEVRWQQLGGKSGQATFSFLCEGGVPFFLTPGVTRACGFSDISSAVSIDGTYKEVSSNWKISKHSFIRSFL